MAHHLISLKPHPSSVTWSCQQYLLHGFVVRLAPGIFLFLFHLELLLSRNSESSHFKELNVSFSRVMLALSLAIFMSVPAPLVTL